MLLLLHFIRTKNGFMLFRHHAHKFGSLQHTVCADCDRFIVNNYYLFAIYIIEAPFSLFYIYMPQICFVLTCPVLQPYFHLHHYNHYKKLTMGIGEFV